MVTRRDLVVAVLITFCLAASMFLVKFVRSQNSAGQYDPWLDWNDDGQINMVDIARVARAFGTSGEAINKTALLIDVNATYGSLLSSIDSLNSSLSELQSQVNSLNATNLMPVIDSLNSSLLALQSQVSSLNTTVTQLQSSDTSLCNSLSQLQSRADTLNNTMIFLNTTIVTMNTTITQLQNSNADLSNRVSSLEGNFSSLLARVSALEGNYSVTNLKLAADAIPFNSTSDTDFTTTNMGSWGNMSYMAVTMTLNRTSHLLIMFSTDAYDDTAGNIIYARAVVDGTVAQPYQIVLTPYTSSELGYPLSHSHIIYDVCSSYNFCQPFVSPGTHTIQIQWFVTGGIGWAYFRTLTVIALPA